MREPWPWVDELLEERDGVLGILGADDDRGGILVVGGGAGFPYPLALLFILL